MVDANPPIDFVAVHEDSTQVYSSDAATVSPIVATDAVIITEMLAATDAVVMTETPAATDAVVMTVTPAGCTGNTRMRKAFIGLQDAADTSNTTFYQYDRRLSLVSNTLDAPASVDAEATANANFGGSMRDEVCPAVPRTFLNEKGCVQQSGSICGTKAFERNAAVVHLDGHTFADRYANGQKHVHAIRGLRLEKYEDGDA